METPKPKRAQPSLSQYSAIGVQLAVYIGLAALGGQKLDAWLQNSRPWCTMALTLTACVGAMVYLIHKLGR